MCHVPQTIRTCLISFNPHNYEGIIIIPILHNLENQGYMEETNNTKSQKIGDHSINFE